MRKRFLATLLAICLIVSMIPFSAAAEGTTVKIDSDDALAAAITAQEGGQVWNFASGETFEVSSMMNLTADNIILNLNGSTITAAENFTGTDNSAHLVNVLGQDIAINNGTLKATEDNKHVLNVYGANGFVAEDLTLDHSEADTGAPMIVTGCSATIKGTFTTITGEKSWYAVNVDNRLNSGFAATTVTFENAEVNFKGDNPLGIQIDATDENETNAIKLNLGEGTKVNTPVSNFYTVVDNAEGGPVTVTTPFGWKTGTMDGKNVYLAPENDLINIVDDKTTKYYATFKAAVDAANEGKDETTINVPAGTFPVTEAINISESVTIQGAGADKTILQATAEPTALIQVAGGNVNFAMDGVYVKGLDTNTHNNSTGLVIGSETGPNYSTGEIKITNCKFTDFTKNGITVKGGKATISDNEIVCKGFEGAAGNGIQIDRGAEATVADNNITGYESQAEKWSATGILVLRDGKLTDESIGNTVKNCQIAVCAGMSYDDADDKTKIPNTVLTKNTFEGNDNDLIYQVGTYPDIADVIQSAADGSRITLFENQSINEDVELNGGKTLSVDEGVTLTVDTDASLTVEEGATLSIGSKAILTNKGTIENNGTIEKAADAIIDGSGSDNVTATVVVVNKAAELREALGDKAVSKIKLGGDFALTEKVTISRTVTIDGDNHTITGDVDNREVYIEVTEGTFTLSDVTLKDFGGEAATASGVAVIKVPDDATNVKVITNNVNFENFCRSAYDIRSGYFEITGGTIDCGNNKTGTSNSKLTKGIVAGLGTNKVSGKVSGVTITNSASNYTEWDSSAIEVYTNADVDITGCTITEVQNGVHVDNYWAGQSGFEVPEESEVSVTITNTTVEATNNAVRLANREETEYPAAVAIKGGNFTGKIKVDEKVDNNNIVITGGTFGENSGAEDYLAPGYELGEDGKVVNTNPGGGTPTEPTEAEPFEDVDENDWFYDEVVYVYENGLMQGTSDTAFSPKNEMDRAMLVTTLYRMEGEPSVADVDVPFTDVTEGYYVDAVAWAYANDIVSGYENNTFQPKEAITREQYVTILHRYAQFKGMDVSSDADLSAFTDAEKVSGWAEEAMIWAVDTELMQGVTETTIAPRKTAQRCQGAALLTRFHQMMA